MPSKLGAPLLVCYDALGEPTDDSTEVAQITMVRRFTVFDDGTYESEDYIFQEPEENTIVEEESPL